MENIFEDKIYFDDVQNSYIEELENDLNSLKDVDYQLILNQNISNSELIDLYKDLFIYLFFCSYDKYMIMLKKTHQYISTSFILKYFKLIDNKLYYEFSSNRYIIIDSGYNVSEDIDNYEIQIKLNKENDYLWCLKPIIKNNHLFYFIQYIGFSNDDDNLMSMEDIENIKVNIYSKNVVENTNILFK